MEAHDEEALHRKESDEGIHNRSRAAAGRVGQWNMALLAMKAYALFEHLDQRGREEEHAVEDWFTAEAIVTDTTE